MAIYKLGELVKIISGSKPLSNNGVQYPIVGSGGIFGKTNKFKYDGPSFTLPRKGTMKIFWYDTPIWNVDTAFLVGDVNDKVANKKYLYYHLKSNENWKKLVTGSTRPSTRITDWRDFSIELPSLKDQEKIIDIIEPLEKLRNKVMSLNVYINNSIELYISKNIETTSLCDISDIKKYSKLINSEDLSPNNDFYYSTGKTFSENKKTNISNFENGLSIPYEGAGMLCKNDNYFVTYHPEKVYIGRKYGIKSKFPMTIYYSIHNRINGELSKNIGLKMPKLTREMLDNMQIISPDKDVEKNFLMFHNLKSKLDNIRDRVDKNISEILLLNII